MKIPVPACRSTLVLLAAALFAAGSAWAHGDPIAKRGGILQQVDELAFELVVRDDKIDLYVYDGADEVPSEGMSGLLTIISGTQRSRVDAKPAGINRLRAEGATAASGSRVVAIVRLGDGKSLAVEFAIP